MDGVADAMGVQERLQLVAARMAHHVEMPRALRVRRLLRQAQRRVRQQFLVPARHAAALVRPLLEILELHAQHRALHAFEPVIVADLVVMIAHGGAVLAQGLRAGRERGVVRHQRAAFAAGAEILRRIKAEGRRGAEAAHRFALVLRAMRLRRVLHEGQIVPPADVRDGIDVERQAVQMHGQHGLRARRDGLFDQRGIEVERLLVNVRIHRPRPAVRDGPARGDESERRGDDLVAGADIVQPHRDMQGGRAAVEAERVLHPAVRREILFKLRHVRPEAERTVVERTRQRGVQLRADGTDLRGQVQIGNFVRHDGIN